VGLSLRLKTLAGYYHQSQIVYDIGCDHGQLGLSFQDTAGVEAIYLVDPSADVISNLKKTIDSYITIQNSLYILHQKGQEIVLVAGSKTIFIAGMGGKEIQEILKHLMDQLSEADRVVISPHRNILELRAWLSESPYNLFEETSLFEEGQFYQILVLTKAKGRSKVHPFGQAIWDSSVGSDYKNHQLGTFAIHQDPLSKAYVAYLRQLLSRI
jgi:tRNA (adenine22-N1)-methyltransferase